tara:strand:+ start:752 stop:1000 length:249 start_codon:yes stop_codon:yes gene_type:complete
MDKRVPHNFKYHAEIQYEGETAMMFTCAVGNTISELFKDIDIEMKHYQHRFPEIVEVIKNPNTWNTDCTGFILLKYYQKGNK